MVGGPARADEEFLEAITGAMRSVLQRLKDGQVQVGSYEWGYVLLAVSSFCSLSVLSRLSFCARSAIHLDSLQCEPMLLGCLASLELQ